MIVKDSQYQFCLGLRLMKSNRNDTYGKKLGVVKKRPYIFIIDKEDKGKSRRFDKSVSLVLFILL